MSNAYVPYYNHPFVSNSTLTSFQQSLSTQDAFSSEDAFRMGTLCDAFITEPDRLNFLNKTIPDSNYSYTKEEWDWAKDTARAIWNSDSACRMYNSVSQFQAEIYKEKQEFEYEGIKFTLDCRCKWDGLIKTADMGWDLKTTTAGKDLNGCLKSMDLFDYDRSAYFYMTITGIKKMVFIFITKDIKYPKKTKMHKVFVSVGDKLWNSGKQKCNELAYKYWMQL